MSDLSDYGYSPFFDEAFRAMAREGEVPARIVEERRGRYRIVREASHENPGDESRIVEEDALPRSRLGREASSGSEMPAVGDWAVAAPTPGGPTLLRALLPRSSAYMRKAAGDVLHDRIEAQVIAANVDLALIVAAAGRDWNPRRVERYLALAAASGAKSLIVITKADIARDPSALLAEAEAVGAGTQVEMVCAPRGLGLDALCSRLRRGDTVVLLGSSGAGKSTLLNALAGEELARTSEVREDDQRGRHTTTHRQLYRLESGPAAGVLVVDTPGMRELQLMASEEDVDAAFPEIEELAASCRFRDCGHDGEPGCAVLEALEEGSLDRGRYEGWRKLAKEAAFLKTREDHGAKDAERRRWKSIAKSQRSFAKGK
jgi:ribosome biogenesis GTPase / thiamine phosphate phosphatase